MWTWAQLGFHQKPCGLLNASGFFDSSANLQLHSAGQFVEIAASGNVNHRSEAGQTLIASITTCRLVVGQMITQTET